MEVRKLPFAETWKPNGFDFSDSGVIQKGPLTAQGSPNCSPTRRPNSCPGGRVVADLEIECDRCLGRASFHIDAPFDLFHRPLASVAEQGGEEVAIDEGEAEIGRASCLGSNSKT